MADDITAFVFLRRGKFASRRNTQDPHAPLHLMRMHTRPVANHMVRTSTEVGMLAMYSSERWLHRTAAFWRTNHTQKGEKEPQAHRYYCCLVGVFVFLTLARRQLSHSFLFDDREDAGLLAAM